jgi:hypothetical protein
MVYRNRRLKMLSRTRRAPKAHLGKGRQRRTLRVARRIDGPQATAHVAQQHGVRHGRTLKNVANGDLSCGKATCSAAISPRGAASPHPEHGGTTLHTHRICYNDACVGRLVPRNNETA